MAPEKWGYFNQIIFNANKMPFERLFCFSQAPALLSDIVPRPLTLLRNKKYKKVLAFLTLILGSSFEAIKRNKSLTILLKDSLNVISLYIIKIKVI